jgi:hypothetical protein
VITIGPIPNPPRRACAATMSDDTSAADAARKDSMRKKTRTKRASPRPSAPQKARSRSTWQAEIGLLWHLVPVPVDWRDVQARAGPEGCEQLGVEQARSRIKLRGTWSTIVKFVRCGYEPVSFHVDRDERGHLAFTDARDCTPGTTGVTEAWRELPLRPRPIQGRSMNAAAFKIEAARYVGAERATELVRVVACDRGA